MKYIEQSTLFGASEVRGVVSRQEQSELFDTMLPDDLRRERELAKQHQDEGGKELLEETK